MNPSVTFHLETFGDRVLVSFRLPRALTPDVLRTVAPPDHLRLGFSDKGVILSGKGPIWLYGFLVHFYHATRYIGVYDPRLRAAVVVESHTSLFAPGDLIPDSFFASSFLTSNSKTP